MSNVKIQRVISIGGRKFATVKNAAEHIAETMSIDIIHAYNDKHPDPGLPETNDAWSERFEFVTAKAIRRITPILEKALNG